MKQVDRYMLRQYLKSFLFIMLTFICVFLLVDLVQKIAQFLDNGMRFFAVVQYYWLMIPWMLHWCFPVSALLAVVFFFGQTNKFNELTAMKAAGFSLYRLSAPFLLFGLLLSLFSFFFEDRVVVPSQQAVTEFMENNMRMTGSSSEQRIHRQVYFQLPDHHVFTIRQYNIKTSRGRYAGLHRIVNGRIVERRDAMNVHWLEEENKWMLLQVQHRIFEGETEIFSKQDTVVLALDVSPRELRQKSVRPEEMPFRQLRGFIERSRQLGMETARWETNLYFRTAMNFACFIVILIGIPLVSFQRGARGFGAGIAAALILLFSFYVLLTFGKVLGIAGELPPFWAVWIPNFFFILIGSFMFLSIKK
ncbi:MAG: LptF/LptG family permease [Candidatus Marinimicrobia bacterium]|nr:LptF/LptG family permease [Candidatus Neomarinimicrobiota bacterium]MDD5709363.1 LptF/LptG family permease [Candidatus Neomarinimicrobiota bacterium]